MTRDEFNRATLGKGTCYCRVEKPRGHEDKAIEHRAARARLHARLPREVDDQIDADEHARADRGPSGADFDRELAEIDRLLDDIRTGRYVPPPELVALAAEALARPDTRTPEQQLADGVRFVLGLGPGQRTAPEAEAAGAGEDRRPRLATREDPTP